MTTPDQRQCGECDQERDDVVPTTIAGELMHLCPDCLPKLKAMDYFG